MIIAFCIICKQRAQPEDFCHGCRAVICPACTGPVEEQAKHYMYRRHAFYAHLALQELATVRRN